VINSIRVPYLPGISKQDALDVLTGIFKPLQSHQLNYEPWPGKGVKPKVEFNIAYGDDDVYLKFLVNERHYRAVHKNANDPVYEDSCVEFFIGFGDEEAYYNFEFNAGGTALVGWGKNRQRELLDITLIKDIRRYALVSVADQPLPFSWELLIAIPFGVFSKNRITTLKNLTCRANFYKCGDKLPEPHFLCWNNIVTDKPNFHLPQYFGKIFFE
jgi:hypothetical protein